MTMTQCANELRRIAGLKSTYRLKTWQGILDEIAEEVWLTHMLHPGEDGDKRLEELDLLSRCIMEEYPELYI